MGAVIVWPAGSASRPGSACCCAAGGAELAWGRRGQRGHGRAHGALQMQPHGAALDQQLYDIRLADDAQQLAHIVRQQRPLVVRAIRHEANSWFHETRQVCSTA
jgi:hypothetical protein